MSRASDGRGSVFRSADGQHWEGYVSLGIDPVTRKRIRRHVRGRTKREVQMKVDQLVVQGARGPVHSDARTTVSDWLDLWIAGRKHHVAPSTLSGYRTDLLHIQRSGTGRIRLDRLTESDLDKLFDWVIASGCNRGTLQHLRRTLNPALETAVARGYLHTNPLTHVQLRGPRGHTATPYDFEEISRLLIAARERRNGARWGIALLGLRQGEVLGLRWHDVDLDRAELTVHFSLQWDPWQHGCNADPRHTAPDHNPTSSPSDSSPTCGKPARWSPQRYGGGPRWAQTKTAAGDRCVAIPEPMLDRLREHAERQHAERLAAGELWRDYDCVFATATGAPIDRTSDREEWGELAAAAKVRQLRIHDLRHTAATALLLLGEDSRTIMGVMGWSASSLVARYAHVVPDLRRRVATRQAALFEPLLPGPSDLRGPAGKLASDPACESSKAAQAPRDRSNPAKKRRSIEPLR